ncbi:P2X purinoceptor 7-like [Ornithodoros turicata]|uniref:P2X purinoceptor 7-like n=1 Tax=Ornithodoros turicata TaxID=34597 RepID=UPI003139AC1E
MATEPRFDASLASEISFFGELTPWEERVLERCRKANTTLYSDTPVLPDGVSFHGVGEPVIDPPTPPSPTRHDNWCACGNCSAMPMAREEVCCTSIAEVRRRCPDGCIVDHSDFQTLCLTTVVMEVMGIEYKKCGLLLGKEPNEIWRHIAYRNFASWIWGPLPEEDRRVLPSCVVMAIRNNFPSPSGSYTGFRPVK